MGLQTELSLFEIVSKVGVVNAGISVVFRKQTLVNIFKSSDFFWVERENTADKEGF